MKRIIILSALIINVSMLFSQTMFDALKVTDPGIKGSARYSAMAGAFGALGGDPSAIKDNPAGLGIYRSSELTSTLDFSMENANSSWYNTTTNDNKYSVGMDNLSFVMALPTWRNDKGYNGLLYSNFSISYNKLKNFNRNVSASSGAVGSSMTDYFGYFTGQLSNSDLEWNNYPTSNYNTPFDNVDLPWMSVMAQYGRLITPYNDPSTGNLLEWDSFLNANETVTPSYQLMEQGGINEYSFGWSGNFSNKFFVGATLNLQSINYQADSKYNEDFGGGGGMTLDNTVITNGTGVNLNVGAIVAPVDFLRFGLSLHTPMIYSLTTYNYSTLNFVSTETGNISSPQNYIDYQVQTPLNASVSAAYIFGNKGLFSAEYSFTNYPGMKMMDSKGNSQNYVDDNQDISNMLNYSGTLKIGAEYKLTNNFSIRAGYATVDPITKLSANKLMISNTTRTDPEYFINRGTNYITCGFGYREANWYIDFAYVNKSLNELYYSYNTTYMNSAYSRAAAKVNTVNNNLIFTLGLKF